MGRTNRNLRETVGSIIQTEITYIFHNCFILKTFGRTLIFDYPHHDFLNAEMVNITLEKIAGEQVYVFASHGHKDHFGADLLDFSQHTDRIHYILSDDIPDPLFTLSPPDTMRMIGDGMSYHIDGIDIETIRSNDAGVAFLIEFDGMHIYYGGDLANWVWEDMDAADVQATEDCFQSVLEKLSQRDIHIAFCNADARLSNWSGAIDFIQKVKPQYFVPMHLFGETAALERFGDEMKACTQPFFNYHHCGDVTMVDVAIASNP